jgi:hypothetical protein
MSSTSTPRAPSTTIRTARAGSWNASCSLTQLSRGRYQDRRTNIRLNIPSFSFAPMRHKEVETEGIAIHRVRDGKIVEYRSVSDIARVLQQIGVLPGPHG